MEDLEKDNIRDAILTSAIVLYLVEISLLALKNINLIRKKDENNIAKLQNK